MYNVCSYGCGQEAKFQFKNGKWCCSKSSNSCPVRRKVTGCLSKVTHNTEEFIVKARENAIKQFSNETIEKKELRIRKIKESMNTTKFHDMFSKIQIDQWRRNEKGKQILREKAIERMKNPLLRKNLSIKQSKRFENLEERLKQSRKYRRSIESLQIEIPLFLKVEEIRYDPLKNLEDKVIQAHCKNKECKFSKEKGGWFTPTNYQLNTRIFVFKQGRGNSFLFCSEKCKLESEVFNRRISPETMRAFLRYRSRVERETRKTIKNFGSRIKNINLRGRKLGHDLDHKYSVYEGFKNYIDPKIIAHHTNLEVISISQNMKKQDKCSISLEHLVTLIKESGDL
jgi:hypothetical protein